MKPSINYGHRGQGELPLLVVICILNPQENNGTFPDLALLLDGSDLYTCVCNKTTILSVVLSWVLWVNQENKEAEGVVGVSLVASWSQVRVACEYGTADIGNEGNVVEDCTFSLWNLSQLWVGSVKSHFNLSQGVIMRIKWYSICDMLSNWYALSAMLVLAIKIIIEK